MPDLRMTVSLQQALEEVGAVIARAHDVEPFLAYIGERERDKARDRIEQLKMSPDGNPWAEWADSTLYKRSRKGNVELGLLLDEGTLRDSIHFVVEGFGVEIGSDAESRGAPYAKYLQEGTEQMPARPYLGWHDDDLAVYAGLLQRWIVDGSPLGGIP